MATFSVHRELATAIAAGLQTLSDKARPDLPAVARDLEATFRGTLDRYRQDPGRASAGTTVAQAAAAVRTACAHLAADDLVDAYLALRAAHDTLRMPAD